ncbi:DUF262 domain-containing protein [Nostoc sp. JL33]|uniref:DUF262 domain-containing protein n=1 Tax=Nostoc sp. JL33 TaxID=2815396 RepID=UPI0025FC59E5|nr:DUF262 domain-containing HNH endonuclease family protein [Nostoc sp. JL33]MBN3873325.1 DUF262 domain-containing protein [Nostoc sp. JL33]
MDKSLNSLSKIFTEKLYRIPDYQRGYAWTEKQLKEFWGDLEQLDKGKNHYLGVLTLEEVDKSLQKEWKDDLWIIQSKNYEPYFVVDGQQRLTTAIILIQAIIECTIENEKLNYTTISEIKKKFIFDSKDEGISRSYIFGYEKDNPSYEFLKTQIFGEKSDMISLHQNTVYTHNLEDAKNFFIEKIKLLNFEQKEEVYRKLTQHLLFNIYTISTDIDVCVTFETMNNRGKPLSYLELLKNRLIYLSIKFNVDLYEQEKLRNSINESWKSIYYNLGRNRNNPLNDDDFLFNHYITYFDEIIAGSNNVEKFSISIRTIRIHKEYYSTYLLEKKFTSKNILLHQESIESNSTNNSLTLTEVYNYVQSLKISVEIWYNIFNPNDSKFSEPEKFWLNKLNRIRTKGSILLDTTLIMVFFSKENDPIKRINFLKSLERLSFLLLLSNDYYYTITIIHPVTFLNWATALSKNTLTVEKLIKEIEEKRQSIINNKEWLEKIKAAFRNEGFYKWQGIRYFLYEYELHLQNQSKTNRDKMNWHEFIENRNENENENEFDYKTIEHIYPQNPRKECWTSRFSNYNPREKNILRHSLGNLLPLSQPKNSTFQNKCFSEKVSGIDSIIGYEYGSYSEIEVSKYNDWTAKKILERGIKLLDFMEKNWNIIIGDKKQKADFLNLNFVISKENINL